MLRAPPPPLAGIPEHLAAALPGFPNLESVGLAEDYASTAAHLSHSAAMQLAPLGALRALRALQLELGIVALAAVPRQVAHLRLVEADRLALPRGAAGVSVADRLLAAAAAQGLESLALEAASGAVVFEEHSKAPLELELSHLARLLTSAAAAAGGAWRVELGITHDAAVGQRRARLLLERLPPAAPTPG